MRTLRWYIVLPPHELRRTADACFEHLTDVPTCTYVSARCQANCLQASAMRHAYKPGALADVCEQAQQVKIEKIRSQREMNATVIQKKRKVSSCQLAVLSNDRGIHLVLRGSLLDLDLVGFHAVLDRAAASSSSSHAHGVASISASIMSPGGRAASKSWTPASRMALRPGKRSMHDEVLHEVTGSSDHAQSSCMPVAALLAAPPGFMSASHRSAPRLCKGSTLDSVVLSRVTYSSKTTHSPRRLRVF
jgi:hypothetical protein